MSKKDRDEFIVIMTQEYPQTPNLAYVLRNLLRYARQHGRLQERACNEQVPEGHDLACEGRIKYWCGHLTGCVPVFSGDPRGATVKLKLPSGRYNDWGQTGICVPQ